MSMNIFRITGDMLHLASFFILLVKLRRNRSAAGLSLKTQEMYLLVFVTRYLDIFTNFYSLYNTVMKLIYLTAAGSIVYTIRFTEPFRTTYDRNQDTFLYGRFAILPCFILALLINQEFSFMEVLWTFSIYLESIAILPQLVILQRYGEVENLTSHYVFALGAYRGFYLLNWIWRFFNEVMYRQWIVWVSGMIQTALYADFFYYYAMSKWYGKSSVSLPK
eukprot:PLAT5239.1.p1 GENE.PLAT5239.1~~PLAT5239.1.p1  ORF type:complete len:220 (+),score=132.85 PLAT5239.1:66-725(+)